jgi:ornithine decarboxylase
LKFAQEKNISLMTFDNEEELKKMNEFFPKAQLLLRLSVADANSSFPLQKKFGVTPENVTHLLTIIKELQLNLIGVSFHVGCDASNPQGYSTAIQEALAVISTANKLLGKPLVLLDIGGGYPGQSTDLFQKISHCIKSVDIPPQMTTISEPGRFLVGICMSVYASIFGKRLMNGVIHYHINDGYYGNLGMDAVRFMVPIPVRKRKYTGNEALEISASEDQTEWKESKIWGPTCDSLDVIVKSCLLPELQIGDRICFREVGAYTSSVSTDFCGFRNDRTLYFE